MYLFTDYIHPLTDWLQQHPNTALFITFLVSLTESLAIVGSIVPGSVTMTAIGILAGSGVMRIDLTFISAILGAVAGDIASYLLGYVYSEKLPGVWPFRRYPNWLSYGKEYFSRHGGKSVLLGRFIGPLRSIIPLIAGMMHMNKWRFIVANVISGILWSVLYVLPGVLIGAASSELSPEVATRLFILIFILLTGVWLFSVGINWVVIHLSRVLRVSLHTMWLRLSVSRILTKPLKMLTPDYEANHYPTAGYFILFILTFLIFCLITVQVYYGKGLVLLNQPIFLFLQSLRTHSFDAFFTIVSQIVSPITLITLVLTIIVLTIYYRDLRSLVYWLSLSIICALVLISMHLLVPSQEPQGFVDVSRNSSFPTPSLTFATTLYVSMALYLGSYSLIRFKKILKTLLFLSLLLAGFSSLYLGDYWFTDSLGAYFCGLSICLAHWLMYRRFVARPIAESNTSLLIVLILLFSSGLSCYLNFNDEMHEHEPYVAQYVYTSEHWWNQSKPLLPIYRTNRFGRRISLFNIQYAGSINKLEQSLSEYGWKTESDSFIDSILKRVSKVQSTHDLPLIAQLYLNKKPVLVMTYEPGNGKPVQVLRLWRSNFHLKHYHHPIWLGSVHPRISPEDKKMRSGYVLYDSLIYVKKALPNYSLRSIQLPYRVVQQPLATHVQPELLLIKKTQTLEN